MAELEQILRDAQAPVSLQASVVGHEEDCQLGHLLTDKELPLPEDAAQSVFRTAALADCLESLDDRQRTVLELRYGLDGGRPRTLDEIGVVFSVTRERIRQIEKQSLAKLAALGEAQQLRSAPLPLATVTLRVALLAPIAWRVPPRHYGPWEQFASLLTEGLVRRGVDVTLFATADSVTTARLVGTAPTGYSEDASLHAKAWEALHISAVFERAGEFDVIHNSFDFLPLTYSRLVDTPLLTTIHGFSSEQIVPVFEKYNESGYYVAISDADRHERLDYVATIHHGIDLAEFELEEKPGDYLLFFGRIHPDKGTVEAIDVAERTGMPLVIAGIVQDRSYFEQLVEPRLDGERVELRGRGRARPPRMPARRGAGVAAPRQLRRAVRLQRRRGDGLRNAGHRDATRLDARDRPSRRERLPRRHPGGSRCRRRRVELPRPGGRARIGGRALRRRPDGGRLPRRLSARRRTPPRQRDRHRGRPLSPAIRGGSRSGSVSTTGRRLPRWAGGRASIRRRSKPTLRESRAAVSIP